jgi:cytochrome P450
MHVGLLNDDYAQQVLLQALHTHPDYWDEPQKFDPQRYI